MRRQTAHTMVAFDTARVERALRGPPGEKAAQEVTAALAEGLTDRLAARTDVRRLSADIRQFEGDVTISFGALAISLAGITLGALAIATAVILLAL